MSKKILCKLGIHLKSYVFLDREVSVHENGEVLRVQYLRCQHCDKISRVKQYWTRYSDLYFSKYKGTDL